MMCVPWMSWYIFQCPHSTLSHCHHIHQKQWIHHLMKMNSNKPEKGIKCMISSPTYVCIIFDCFHWCTWFNIPQYDCTVVWWRCQQLSIRGKATRPNLYCLNVSYLTYQGTSLVCPWNVWTHSPDDTFHSLIVVSKDDVAMNCPSGENRQLLT